MKQMDDATYNFVFSLTPRICIDLIIPMSGSVLIGQRSHEPYKDMWALPGGRLFFGESVESAIKRICQKEISCEVSGFKLVNYSEYLDEIELIGRHSLSFIFEVELEKGNTPKCIPECFSELSVFSAVKNNDIVRQHSDLINIYLKK